MMTLSSILSAFLALGLLNHFRMERQAVRRLARRFQTKHAGEEPAALALTEWVYRHVPKLQDDPAFLSLPLPGLASLGPSPMQVVRDGGCCSGRARLLICLLEASGIQASQLTLHHRSGVARHALVEARIDGRWHALDPHYGFVYRDQEGEPVGLHRLRGGVEPIFETMRGEHHPGYRNDPYYDFQYEHSTTANWTCSRPRRVVFRLLDRMTARRIRVLRQPHWAEWPQLPLALLAGLPFLWSVWR